MVSITELHKRLEQLREDYRNQPERRKTIEAQGKLLKIALEMAEKNQGMVADVVEGLF